MALVVNANMQTVFRMTLPACIDYEHSISACLALSRRYECADPGPVSDAAASGVLHLGRLQNCALKCVILWPYYENEMEPTIW